MEERALLAERDERRTGAFGKEDIAGPASVVHIGYGDPGQRRGLVLVRRDVVAKRKDIVLDRFGRRRIEDRGHGRAARYFEASARRRDGLLELGDEDGGAPDRIRSRLHVGRADPRCRARHDDDRVLAVLLVDVDEGRSGRLVRVFRHPRRDAFGFPRRKRDTAEIILADPRNEGNRAAGACCRNGLVRALTARTEFEAGTGDRLADARHPPCAESEIGHEDT